MPTTIIMKNGGQLAVVGDSVRTAVVGSLLFGHPFWLRAVALNGREVWFKRSQRIGYIFQPEAEYRAQIAAEEAAKKKQEEEAKANQEKADALRDAALKQASAEFIAQYGPDPANWPESARPKKPAIVEPQPH